MKRYNLLLTTLLLFLLPASGNEDERNWKLKDGKGQRIQAELLAVNEDNKTVDLLIKDQIKVTYNIEDFSEIDIAWIYEWLNIQDELEEKLSAVDGKLEHVIHKGTYETDLYIYYPSTYTADTASDFPLMLLFNAGGKAKRYLTRHIEAAEETQFLTIALGQFRNTDDHDLKEAMFLERFKEVFPYIRENITFHPEKAYMGGISGGAWKAYHYSAWVDYPWAGIFANGGWLGEPRKYYDLDYRDHMRVAIVNGHNDHANRVVERDLEVLKKHNATVSLISFEGGHQIAPTKTQVRAFQWLLESETFEEANVSAEGEPVERDVASAVSQ